MNSFPASNSGVVRECVNCLNAVLMPEAGGTMGRKLPLPFETPNIRLRQFEDDDWKDLMEFAFKDEADATDWLNNVSKARLTDLSQTFYLAVEMRATKKISCSIGLRFADPDFDRIIISSDNFPKSRRASADSDACEAALGFCFQGLHVHRAVASCPGEDSESLQVLTKSGMRREAEFIKSERNEVGQWRNVVWFAMLAEEYNKSKLST